MSLVLLILAAWLALSLTFSCGYLLGAALVRRRAVKVLGAYAADAEQRIRELGKLGEASTRAAYKLGLQAGHPRGSTLDPEHVAEQRRKGRWQ